MLFKPHLLHSLFRSAKRSPPCRLCSCNYSISTIQILWPKHNHLDYRLWLICIVSLTLFLRDSQWTAICQQSSKLTKLASVHSKLDQEAHWLLNFRFLSLTQQVGILKWFCRIHSLLIRCSSNVSCLLDSTLIVDIVSRSLAIQFAFSMILIKSNWFSPLQGFITRQTPSKLTISWFKLLTHSIIWSLWVQVNRISALRLTLAI
jgi:hypothetical protein